MGKLKISLVLVMLVLAAMACEFNFSTANIGDAYLASDQDGNNKATTFAPTDTVYAIVEVKNAPDDTKTKAVWYAVDVAGVEPNFSFGESELEGGGSLYFSFNHEDGLPVGKYKVDILLNDEQEKSLSFEVQ